MRPTRQRGGTRAPAFYSVADDTTDTRSTRVQQYWSPATQRLELNTDDSVFKQTPGPITLRPGDTIYHGTAQKLRGDYPSNDGGNWFAVERGQSELHAIDRLRQRDPDADGEPTAYLYQYRVVAPLRLLNFGNQKFYAQAVRDFIDPSLRGQDPFDMGNGMAAARLCRASKFDGWINVFDQSEIMICQPRKFLELEGIYRYEFDRSDYERLKEQLSDLPPLKRPPPSNEWPGEYRNMSADDIAEIDDGAIESWIVEQPSYDRAGLSKNAWVIRDQQGRRRQMDEEDHTDHYSRLAPHNKKYLRKFVRM